MKANKKNKNKNKLFPGYTQENINISTPQHMRLINNNNNNNNNNSIEANKEE